MGSCSIRGVIGICKGRGRDILGGVDMHGRGLGTPRKLVRTGAKSSRGGSESKKSALKTNIVRFVPFRAYLKIILLAVLIFVEMAQSIINISKENSNQKYLHLYSSSIIIDVIVPHDRVASENTVLWLNFGLSVDGPVLRLEKMLLRNKRKMLFFYSWTHGHHHVSVL